MKEALPDIRLVGLCHSVQHTTAQWAHRLKVPLEEVKFECAGLNHQAWIFRFEHQGRDMLPAIRELAVDPRLWRKDTSRMEYIKHFGFPVTEASGHNSEYSAWFRKRPDLIEAYCPGGGWNGGSGFIKELYNRPDWREVMEKMADGTEPVSLERSNEYGSQIVSALAGGDPVKIYGNVMNEGYIANLPDGVCVEVPCFVGGSGIEAQAVGSIPAHLAAINQTQINVQRLAVKAALESDPECVFQAMALDPLTAAVGTLDEIRAMTAELMAAHSEWLPAFSNRGLAAKPRMVGHA